MGWSDGGSQLPVLSPCSGVALVLHLNLRLLLLRSLPRSLLLPYQENVRKPGLLLLREYWAGLSCVISSALDGWVNHFMKRSHFQYSCLERYLKGVELRLIPGIWSVSDKMRLNQLYRAMQSGNLKVASFHHLDLNLCKRGGSPKYSVTQGNGQHFW
ncbi:hypothetical protein R1flu_028425 [Riccia fluitans]|uniref:Maturase K n=1 Tax=Riccia fluitans TaxID=41844 RepID=A0ABD1XLQ1_9MARC